MKDFQVQAKVPATDTSPEKVGALTVKAPENIEEAVKMFGGEVVLSNAMANWKVTLQGTLRGGLKRGETQEQLQQRLGGSKMGVVATKGGGGLTREQVMAAWRADYQAATPADRKKMMNDLIAEAAKE